VEHTQPIDQSFSWRGTALALGLVLVIALAVLGGRALLHRSSGANGQTRHVPSATLRPRSATSVLVLNGNGIAGAAGGVSSRLLADGYRGAPTANAQVTNYARSIVLFRRGWAGEAERLAKDAGIGAVARLDGDLPTAGSQYPLVAIVGH
jgi:hypothetical protein